MSPCWCGEPATSLMRVSDGRYGLHVATCDEHEWGEIEAQRIGASYVTDD